MLEMDYPLLEEFIILLSISVLHIIVNSCFTPTIRG